jgi:uncharacterized membrane protein YidH (DUF202 family)
MARDDPQKGGVPADAAWLSAAERTDLAWVRSAIALGAVGAAMLKNFRPTGRSRPVEGAIALALAAAVLLLAAGYVLGRRRAGASVRRSLMLVSAGTVAIGIVAVVIGCTG